MALYDPGKTTSIGNPAYRSTKVLQCLYVRELQVSVAHALPTLRWRHHALGVLQAYLTESDPEVRVHIWHPALVRLEKGEGGRIHDHRFTMDSTVLFGAIEHNECHATEDPKGLWSKYTVIHAREGKPDLPEACEGGFSLHVVTGTIPAGYTYIFQKGAFHSSRVEGLVVTIVTKHEQEDRRAMLLVPKGFQPRHGMSHGGGVDIERFVAMAKEALLSGGGVP